MNGLTLYARAALPLVPGASRLPFVAGGGGEMPALERALDGVIVDPRHLADYARVCGFTLRDALPATYLHVRAFPLHMSLMTDGRFPFPAVGLVHLRNRITVRRPISATETLGLRAHVTPIEPHPKGRTFTIVTEAHVGGELVWEGRSTMLRRGSGDESRSDPRGGAEICPPRADAVAWRLAADLGRRYASVSGDRNPIHLHAATARLFGFPKAIAHGMWTKARCLAALEANLPDAYAVDVSFRKPILLPGSVTFTSEGEGRFAVRAANDSDLIHLEGTVTP
jgi:hypothetical protein